MELTRIEPPREFRVGADGRIVLRDCAHIELAPDEQVTFTTPQGGELDVCRKAWGFYAAPSLNARLPRFGLRPALVHSRANDTLFLLVVERGHEEAFSSYLAENDMRCVLWLDGPDALRALAALEAR